MVVVTKWGKYVKPKMNTVIQTALGRNTVPDPVTWEEPPLKLTKCRQPDCSTAENTDFTPGYISSSFCLMITQSTKWKQSLLLLLLIWCYRFVVIQPSPSRLMVLCWWNTSICCKLTKTQAGSQQFLCFWYQLKCLHSTVENFQVLKGVCSDLSSCLFYLSQAKEWHGNPIVILVFIYLFYFLSFGLKVILWPRW